MKKQFVKSAIATAVMGVALVAAGSAVAGIANTKHNLGSAGNGPNKVSNTGEICVFCHTPHGGDIGTTAAPVAVPLWNKRLTQATFTTYDQLGTSTLDAAITTIGSVTLACLTCHDGTQALDNIRNAPGSGGFDATGGNANGLLWTWAPGGTLTADGQMQNSVDAVGGTNIFAIGTDLRNDHPVSVQYGGGGVSSTNAGPLRDSDFVLPTRIGAADRWYVENGYMATNGSSLGAGTGFDKWDFKLYTRTGTGTPANGATFAGEPEPFVECGSCHDPHLETTTFLRIDPTINGGASNNGSQICLTCHTK
jgi:hypothetical protein